MISYLNNLELRGVLNVSSKLIALYVLERARIRFRGLFVSINLIFSGNIVDSFYIKTQLQFCFVAHGSAACYASVLFEREIEDGEVDRSAESLLEGVDRDDR